LLGSTPFAAVSASYRPRSNLGCLVGRKFRSTRAPVLEKLEYLTAGATSQPVAPFKPQVGLDLDELQ
jgi:hypothetical protein